MNAENLHFCKKRFDLCFVSSLIIKSYSFSRIVLLSLKAYGNVVFVDFQGSVKVLKILAAPAAATL